MPECTILYEDDREAWKGMQSMRETILLDVHIDKCCVGPAIKEIEQLLCEAWEFVALVRH